MLNEIVRLQRPIGSGAARVVDQNHGRNRGATKNVKRNLPPLCCREFENRRHNFWLGLR
jgi:hypothetical protein